MHRKNKKRAVAKPLLQKEIEKQSITLSNYIIPYNEINCNSFLKKIRITQEGVMMKKNNSNKSNAEKIKNIKPKKRKNVSQKYRNGLILQTRDEYFEGSKNYRKPGYENKGNYRKAVVVDSNRDNELAVVKGLSNGIDLKIPGIKAIKPYIETKDDNGQPIVEGRKFVNSGKCISQKKLAELKIECLKHSSKSLRKENKSKLKKLKGRK